MGAIASSLIDRVALGRILRGDRIKAGYDRVADLTREIRRVTGVAISDRTLYAIERGEQPVSLDVFVALCLVLEPEGGFTRMVSQVLPDKHSKAWNELV